MRTATPISAVISDATVATVRLRGTKCSLNFVPALACLMVALLASTWAFSEGPKEVSADNISGIALGFHTHFNYGQNGAADNYAPIAELIEKLGHKPALVHGFYSWKNIDGSYRAFPREFADYAVAWGATPLITWQPGAANEQNQVERPQADWTCVQIASGKYDDYIKTWATAAKACPHTLYVRLMHEFNAAPYPWAYSVDHANNAPEKYVAAFRHVVDIFHKTNVSNVQFVWCFGCGAQEPPPENWFPGDDYIEWIGLDGYNYGFVKDGSQKRWRTYEEVYAVSYARLTKISRRPVIICEIACAEDVDKKGSMQIVDKSSKPNWIKNTFITAIPQKTPRVKAVVLFNSVGHNFPSYVIDSSPETLAAFKAIAADKLYQAAAPDTPIKYQGTGHE